MVNIIGSSPKAAQSFDGKKYPFSDLDIGFSFTVPYDKKIHKSLGTLCSQWNAKKNGKRYRCLLHRDLNLIEVACIAA